MALIIWFYILIFILSSLALVQSGVWVIRVLNRIAEFLGWREFVVASVLMSFATSLPEIFIGITSALAKKPELAFGVIIGSNIINLTLVIGIGVLVAKGLRFESKIIQRSSLYAGLYGILPLVLILDGKISRPDGVILLLALAFYFFQLLSQERKFTKIFSNQNQKGWSHFKLFLKDLFVFWIAIGFLLLSSEGIIFAASRIAVTFNISLVIIGAILVAFGTSLPELVVEIRAAQAGRKKTILGNIMGSVIVNSALVLGLVAIISPFEITNFSPYLIGIIFTVVTSLFFVLFAKTDSKITEREAIFLIGIYIIFFLAQITVG
ncbi:MAG: sodium:calcium antiporter [Patescibacteria group bacterium]|nr:sodium:calcium antiporter [Patescibacteria group bacterium]